MRGWITDSIKPTLLNKGIKTESRGAFSIDEYQAIYKGIPLWIKKGHRKETRELREVLREYVLFLANTGIRHGTEAISIKWSNIRYFTGLDKLVYLEVAVDGKVGKRKLVPRDNTARYLERLRDLNDSIKHLTLKSCCPSNWMLKYLEHAVDTIQRLTRSGEVLGSILNRLVSCVIQMALLEAYIACAIHTPHLDYFLAPTFINSLLKWEPASRC